uniref:PFL domain-containing protein n=1 Tax=Angiostrongylus cantonensis TaxID=6313 RepID=A0A0K0DJ32_ANGCA
MKAESSKVTKRRLSPGTLELIRQCGIARAAGNRGLTSELAKQCRKATKEDLRERRAAVMVEAEEAGKHIRKACRSFANCKTEMIALRCTDGTVTASRKAKKKIIHKYYSDLFDSQVHLPSYKIKEDEIFAKLWTAGVYGGERTRYCPFRGVTRSPPHHAGPTFRLSP